MHELAERPAIAGGLDPAQLKVQANQTKALEVQEDGRCVLGVNQTLVEYAEEVQDTLPDGAEVTLGDMESAACSYAGESLPIHS
jgi:hypothetical protein